jgi:hypothetical protein
MPNPLYLKVMNTTLSEYNTLKSDEKEEFATEARQRIAELSNDPVAYTELTNNTPVPESAIPEFTRNKRKKSKGDN